MLAGGLCALALVGCTRRHTVERSATGAPEYDELHVVYQLRDGHGALGSHGLQPVRLVSGVEGETRKVPDHLWETATLEIEYPHPGARPGWARATLRLSPDLAKREAKSAEAREKASLANRMRGIVGWSDDQPDDPAAPDPATRGDASGGESAPQTSDEIWVLDLPREQLDLLLVDLARSGFFEDQTRPVGGARVAVELDAGREDKLWDPDPRLDDLAERVYTEGWIRGFAPRGDDAADGGSWWSF